MKKIQKFVALLTVSLSTGLHIWFRIFRDINRAEITTTTNSLHEVLKKHVNSSNFIIYTIIQPYTVNATSMVPT
jgi:hypothetical protein